MLSLPHSLPQHQQNSSIVAVGYSCKIYSLSEENYLTGQTKTRTLEEFEASGTYKYNWY